MPSHTIPLLRDPNLKTVMTVHDLGAEYLPKSHQLKQQLYLKFITKYQLKTTSGLIAVSQATKKDLTQQIGLKPSKVVVIYEGVTHSSETSSKYESSQVLEHLNLKEKQYFLFVGTIQPRKNLIRLIEAFSLF